MTTTAQFEAAKNTGSPYELFLFDRAGARTAYTSADASISYGGNLYLPRAMRRTSIKQSDETGTIEMRVSLPEDDALVAAFISGLSSVPTSVTMFASHRTATDTEPRFFGQVQSVSFKDGYCELLCTTITSHLERGVPRAAVQRTCPWMLYDPNCGLSALAFTQVGTIAAVANNIITVSGVPNIGAGDQYYANGQAIIGANRQFILRQVADQLTLMGALPGAGIGIGITLTAGCDKLAATCNSRFANINRHGGYVALPSRDPMDRLV